MFFYYRQKLLPRVINSRRFFQLLLCCWHDERHRHQQERAHGLPGEEGNAGAITRGEAGWGAQEPPASSHQAVHFPGGIALVAAIQNPALPAIGTVSAVPHVSG